jgi:hypothetical protein
MLKSIGLAAAVLAVISFVQPPTASAQDRAFNQRNSSSYASTQNRGRYDNFAQGQDRSNYGYGNDQPSYGYGRQQNVNNDYRDSQLASQLRYGGPANDWSRERSPKNFRTDRNLDDHDSSWR